MDKALLTEMATTKYKKNREYKQKANNDKNHAIKHAALKNSYWQLNEFNQTGSNRHTTDTRTIPYKEQTSRNHKTVPDIYVHPTKIRQGQPS